MAPPTSAALPPHRAVQWSARLDARLAELRERLDPCAPDPVLATRRDALRAIRTTLRLVRYALVDAAELHRLLERAACDAPPSDDTDDSHADRILYAALAAELPAHTPVRRYRLALADVRLYCRWPIEGGVLGGLKEPDRIGEPVVLDRLTRLLERLGRADEIVAAADGYFAEFPDARRTPAGERVRRRCERAAAGRLQRGPRAPAGRKRGGRMLG